jgi:hypothetical protein
MIISGQALTISNKPWGEARLGYKDESARNATTNSLASLQ